MAEKRAPWQELLVSGRQGHRRARRWPQEEGEGVGGCWGGGGFVSEVVRDESSVYSNNLSSSSVAAIAASFQSLGRG